MPNMITEDEILREKIRAVLYEVAYNSDQFMGLVNGLDPYVNNILNHVRLWYFDDSGVPE